MKRYVVSGRVARDSADEIVDAISRYPAESRSLQSLLPTAWRLSIASGLTVYDACYLALAAATKATLVTFDTDFVGLYDRLELLA